MGAEPATACAGIEPPARHARGGIGDDRQDAGQGDIAWIADQPVGDGAADHRAIGCPAKLVADQMGDAGLFRRRQHGAGLGQVGGHRLFAKDVAAPLDRGQGKRGMGGGRRGDRYHNRAGAVDRFAQIREDVSDVDSIGAAAGAVRVGADEARYLEPGGAQGGNMNAAAKAGADDDRAGGRGHGWSFRAGQVAGTAAKKSIPAWVGKIYSR